MRRRLRITAETGSWKLISLGAAIGLLAIVLITGTLVVLSPPDPPRQPQPHLQLMTHVR